MHRFRVDPALCRPLEVTDQLALAQQPDAIGDLTGSVDVVGHHQDRPLVVRQRPHERVELIDGDRIEARRRLVEQQDRRVAKERQGDRNLLAHALRVGAEALVARLRLEGDAIECLIAQCQIGGSASRFRLGTGMRVA